MYYSLDIYIYKTYLVNLSYYGDRTSYNITSVERR